MTTIALAFFLGAALGWAFTMWVLAPLIKAADQQARDEKSHADFWRVKWLELDRWARNPHPLRHPVTWVSQEEIDAL